MSASEEARGTDVTRFLPVSFKTTRSEVQRERCHPFFDRGTDVTRFLAMVASDKDRSTDVTRFLAMEVHMSAGSSQSQLQTPKTEMQMSPGSFQCQLQTTRT